MEEASVKLGIRFGAVIGSATLATVAGLTIGTNAGHAVAVAPIDVTHDHVVCNTLVGELKFSPVMTTIGGDQETVTVKAKVDGCTDTDNSNVKIGPSTLQGRIFGGNNCSLLTGGSWPVTGSMSITWKSQHGSATLIANGGPAATKMIVAVYSATIDGSNSWGAGYPQEQYFGGSNGNTVSGAFDGGEAGASTAILSTLGDDTNAMAEACNSSKGLKSVPLGIGHVSIG
jgi:hypothetical protein